MHTWHWQTWQGLSYLTCSVLEPYSHGFFTQQFSPRPPEELVNVLDAEAQVYRVKQVHGDVVLTPSEVEIIQSQTAGKLETAPPLPDADGLLTDDSDQAVWVCSADCTPVLIADVESGQVAAIHAGWRGTAAEIVPKAIVRLQDQGSQLQNLRIAMGPAIAGDVYQVSTTVAAEIGATLVPSALTHSPESILEALYQLPHSPLLADPQPGRARIDVRQVSVLQLEKMGIQPDQVAIAPYCTYQSPEHFFSYRRNRLKKVQWSGIVSG
ncbi:peptidoglycan editing factor PgeF [Oculatella sp. LEGE 06141]|nr:peptidoglycan editing factor PgeF [Oculatella sp. LEGE 06141]